MIPSKVRQDIRKVTNDVKHNLIDYIDRPDVIRDELADLIDNHCHLTFIETDENTLEIIKLWMELNPSTPKSHRQDIMNYIDHDITHFRIDEIDHENISTFESMIGDITDKQERTYYRKKFQHYLSAISLPKNVSYRKEHYQKADPVEESQNEFQKQSLVNRLDQFMANLTNKKPKAEVKEKTPTNPIDEQLSLFSDLNDSLSAQQEPKAKTIKKRRRKSHKKQGEQLSIF